MFSFLLSDTDYNVQAGVEDYKSSIEKLHKKLNFQDQLYPDQERYLFDFMLHPNPKHQCFYVNLKIYIIGRFYLKLLGYQSSGCNGHHTFEFGDNDNASHHLSTSSFLGFNGDYKSLEDIIGISRDQIPLNKDKFLEAVSYLSTCPEPSDHENSKCEIAWSLIVLKQMIVEAIRYPAIAQEISDHYDDERGWQPSSKMLQLELEHDSHPVPPPPPPPSPAPYYPSPPIDEDLGCTMLEMLGVCINFEGTIHGTIKVMDGDFNYQGHSTGQDEPYFIYNRAVDDPQVFKRGETALLIGNSCIRFSGPINIYVDLRDENGRKVAETVWKWSYQDCHVWDEVLEANLQGMDGLTSVTLYYAAMMDAIEAAVEVELIRGVDPNNVCGFITSTIDNIQSEKCQSFLFWKPEVPRGQGEDQGLKQKQKVTQRWGQLIPLSRSNVAVPMDSYLIITAKLIDGDTKEVIADGSEMFFPRDFFTYQRGHYTYVSDCKYVMEINRKIRVKVTWWPT